MLFFCPIRSGEQGIYCENTNRYSRITKTHKIIFKNPPNDEIIFANPVVPAVTTLVVAFPILPTKFTSKFSKPCNVSEIPFLLWFQCEMVFSYHNGVILN